MKQIFLFILCCSFLCSCQSTDDDEHHPCYDASIVHNNACTADCPGILGCDDKTYCNECEAARVGIRPK